ncbi:L-rhamnose-binding lectin CSL2-like [Scomber japonicus]|uniref:L-rhamnose-binding lectin CSL2-like n=1 Tax=Scomber japonicus TaxID=13676 RepID=UPI0023066F34|nr:L-rhamnose-binding lectin CSL2-like [Scomber japonicus]
MLTCDLETQTQKINCGQGLVVVQSVAASHRETESCVNGVRPDLLDAPLCSSNPVLHIAQNRCNGRHRCSVQMDSCHSARPCSSRCFWMETTYRCIPGRIHYVCQKRRASLYCGRQVIKVLMANYGRTSRWVCSYSAPHRQPPNTGCRNHDSLKVMSHRCDGKHKCSVRASNHIFSNACPGTRKYLQYSYTCVDPGSYI